MVECENCKPPITGEQGFIDENHLFLNRQEALKRAKETNQILFPENKLKNKLFSENLY